MVSNMSRLTCDKPITPHYGRNFIITRLAEAGATPREIGRILGQEDVSTIVNVYMKSREARPVELMRRVDLDEVVDIFIIIIHYKI